MCWLEAHTFKYRKSDENPGMVFYSSTASLNTIRTFHRADFQQSLLRRLPASCKTHCSKRLQSYSQQPTGLVEIVFEDGSTAVCDVLIGADGLKSAVRRKFVTEQVPPAQSKWTHTEIAEHDASAEPVWSGILAYRALIPAERLRSQAPDHPAFSTSIRYFYLGKNNVSVSATVNGIPVADRIVAVHSRPFQVGATFDGPWASTVDRAEFTSLFSTWEPEVQMLISDAYILATLLGHRTTTRQTLEHALLVYVKVRRPRAIEVVSKSRRNGKLLMMDDYDFRGMSNDAVLKELRSSVEEIDRLSEWTWTTSIDESVQQALTMLLGNVII
ncbi:hypothetical protein H0H81_011679 [Sphagnurus paluster]|uniref:FAD-binding domain-containing protein n=1 Tax=Sphagnurus paluster TaxID=117069 RepID=A0A9P7K696_9AGAR|nr:hypothetical protein H0H81_011679 [Sphagnurus paluster]